MASTEAADVVAPIPLNKSIINTEKDVNEEIRYLSGGFQSVFGGVYGENGTILQRIGSLHDLPPGKSRRIYRQIM